MPGRKSDTELDDLNLHVKSPLANDLASRFGDPSLGKVLLNISWRNRRWFDSPQCIRRRPPGPGALRRAADPRGEARGYGRTS